MYFQLLYPEKRIVSADTLIGWAQDYEVSNRQCTCGADQADLDCLPTCAWEAPMPDFDAFQAAEILSDAGEITLGNHGNPL
jgi:hypothetical protein